MELFKLLGKIAIDNSEANKDLDETSSKAKQTSETIQKSNQNTKNSNKSTESSWSNLKSKVNEYKAQGMTTSQAWSKASADMRSSTEGSSNSMVGAFKKVAVAVGSYLAVDKVIQFGKGCIQAAADASAAESQFSQVFGDLEGKASKSLTKIADESGVSENRMKGSFTKIAAFAKTTGMDTEDALGLSERAMVAVADSAAFYDRSLEETTESLQSFLKGNYENDAALGLSCTEVTRNEAANRLYGKSFKDLSESQKQLTLLKMVEDANKASGALGQAARESDTWTNVLGNLKQGWTDFQAVLGSYVLPKAVEIVKKMVGVVEEWTAKLPALVNWCKEHSAELKGLAVFVGAVATAIGIYSSGLTLAAVKTTIMTAATSAFAGVMGFLTSPVTLVIAAIGALAAAFVVGYNKSETFRNFINKLKDGLVNGFNAMKEKISDFANTVKDKFNQLKEWISPLLSKVFEPLKAMFSDIGHYAGVLGDKIGELLSPFKEVGNYISGAFGSAVDDTKEKFNNIKNTVKEFVENALGKLTEKLWDAYSNFEHIIEVTVDFLENLKPLATMIKDNLLNSLQNLKEPIQTIKEAFGTIGDVIMNHLLPALRDALMPLWDSLKNALSGVAGILGGALVAAFGLAVGAINGIVSAISGFVQAFSGIVEIVANVFKLIVGIFTLNGEQCKEALQGIWDGVCKVFGGLWEAVSGFLKGFVDGVVGFFKGLWDTLVGHSIVPDTIDGIVDCFAGLWGKVKGLVTNFKNGVVNTFNNVKEKAISAFNTAKDKVVSSATTLKNKVSSAWDSVKSKTSSAFSSAKDKASSTWDSLKNKVSSVASSTKEKVSSTWDSLKSKTSTAFSSAKDKASTAFSSLKDKVTSYASNTASSAGEKFNSLKSKVSSAVDSAKSKATSAFSSIKSSISSHVSGAYSTVASKFDSIKSKISSVMESARSVVSSAVSKLKSAFNFSWSLPKLKLPHISVSGGKAPYGIGGAGSLPKFSIKWHKEAYEKPRILKQPDIFAYNSKTGEFLGGGDGNGGEVVAGERTLMKMIQTAVAEQNEAMIYYLQKIIEILADYFPQLLASMERDLVTNDGLVVAHYAPLLDEALGKIKERKDRGR